MGKKLFSVNREWQDVFCEYLNDMGFDSYGMIKDEKLLPQEVGLISDIDEGEVMFENEVFSVMPYYWGRDERISKLPNFVYKPSHFELSWYKYPLRSAEMNKDISLHEMEEILTKCLESLNKMKVTKIKELDIIEIINSSNPADKLVIGNRYIVTGVLGNGSDVRILDEKGTLRVLAEKQYRKVGNIKR